MNSKLYFEFSKELSKAEKELKIAKDNYKQYETVDTQTALQVAECKVNQWQKAVNLLYIKGK